MQRIIYLKGGFMKKFIYLFVPFLIITILFSSLNSGVYAITNNLSKITVNGTGEVQMIPDTVIVSMGVESLNKVLTDAESENSEKMNNVINILYDYGIKKENIKTRSFNVFPKYDYNKNQNFLGYQVSNNIDFKTSDIEHIGEIITKITEAGTNCFNGVSFTVEDNDLAYNQALENAINNARNKAYSLLESDVELKVLEITEESVYSYRGLFDNYSTSKAISENVPIMEGEIIVKANVKVVFGYELNKIKTEITND